MWEYIANILYALFVRKFSKVLLAVAVTLAVPHIGGDSHEWLNGLYCAAVILFIYPPIVAAGAGSELKGRPKNNACGN